MPGNKTAKFFKDLMPYQIHIQIVKKDNGAADYCMKEEGRLKGPWEHGKRPANPNSKTDWDTVWEAAKVGNFESIPKGILIRNYSSICRIKKDNMKFEDSDDLRGVWIWGKSGVGKSRWAREIYADAYPKLCNKWWDGYQDQEYVIMDDIRPMHKILIQQLLIWSDRYGVILENKGGAMTSKYRKFVVTSQYQIEDIFEDPKDVEAMKRRFKVVHMPHPITEALAVEEGFWPFDEGRSVIN